MGDRQPQYATNQHHPQKPIWERLAPGNALEAYTLVLTIATLGLWYFTCRMARATRDAVRLGRDEFNATHRPKLRVRNVVAKSNTASHWGDGMPFSDDVFAFSPGGPLSGQFYVSNTGSSAATITESHCEVIWDLKDGLPMERPYEGKNGNNPLAQTIVESGSSAVGLFLSDANFPGLHWDEGDKSNVYVMGWVEYVDASKVSRRTAFCRRYMERGGSRRFYPVDDPDYEHEE